MANFCWAWVNAVCRFSSSDSVACNLALAAVNSVSNLATRSDSAWACFIALCDAASFLADSAAMVSISDLTATNCSSRPANSDRNFSSSALVDSSDRLSVVIC